MPAESDTIISILADMSVYTRTQIVALLNAGAPAHIITGFGNILSHIEQCTCMLGEELRRQEYTHGMDISIIQEIMARLERIEKYAQNPPIIGYVSERPDISPPPCKVEVIE